MGFCIFNSKNIGMDLGTSNILITMKGKGIILREPSVVAMDIRSKKIVATGNEAKEMFGKTPETIRAIKPLKNGAIADFTATKLMLKNIFKKLGQKYNIKKPKVIVTVPTGITEVEERAVEETIIQAGGKEIYLIDEPIASAIGIGIHIEEPSGNMIINIGGGTTQISVISLGGIVVSESLKIAGDELNQSIIEYIKRTKGLAIGEATAEEIKVNVGCAMAPITETSIEIRGRDLATGLPRNERVTSTQALEAMTDSINRIINGVKATLEKTPPELLVDLAKKGMVLTGGGAMIKNLDQLLSNITNIPVYIADDPLECAARGTTKVLQELDKLKPVVLKKEK